jgi:hypothetical protein
MDIVLRCAKHGCGGNSMIQRNLMMTIGGDEMKQRQRSGICEIEIKGSTPL